MSGWFPPVFLDWIFIVLVAPFFLAGITMTICILSAGRYLFCRRCYSLALVIARIECLFVPFGTILGACCPNRVEPKGWARRSGPELIETKRLVCCRCGKFCSALRR